MRTLHEIVINKLIKKRLKISLAESCTGGLLSSIITSVKGSSKVLNLGLVVYSNQSKMKLLKISKNMLKKYGAVSEQVCTAMAQNVSKVGKTNMSVSVTGITGPTGGSKRKPVGLVFIGVKKDNKINTKKYLFKNKGRVYIQKASVKESLKLILSALK